MTNSVGSTQQNVALQPAAVRPVDTEREAVQKVQATEQIEEREAVRETHADEHPAPRENSGHHVDRYA